jgi:aldehyde dehydrogenase (NAD+)
VFDSGKTKAIEWRLQQLKQIEKMVVENADAMIEALAKDLGRPATESVLADVGVTVDETRIAINKLQDWIQPESVVHPLKLQPGRQFIVHSDPAHHQTYTVPQCP